MRFIRFVALSFGLLLALQSTSLAVDEQKYNYIDAEATAKLIRENAKIAIIDIQPKSAFDKEHLQGAIPTYAYPMKSAEEKAAVEAVIPQLRSAQKVVIVCPKGGGGADKTYDYLLSSGFAKENILTLKKGQDGWPRDVIKDVLVK